MEEYFKRFISFEGIDFSGKTTQIKQLTKKLKARGILAEVFREPGGTVISEKIREILLSTEHREMHKITETLLYEAARAQLVHQKILPMLKAGKYVIGDRFFDSTTCYQGFGRELDLEFLEKLHRFATSGLIPYKTFFIDIPPREAEERRLQNKHRQDRLESGGLDFFERIRAGFIYLCDKEPGRFIRINGMDTPENISQKVWNKLATIWDMTSF